MSWTVVACVHRALAWPKWGRPAPMPDMSVLKYRGLELIINSMSTTALALGMCLTYVFAVRWLEPFSELHPPLHFWFPLGDKSALFLSLFVVRDLVKDVLVYYIATKKAKTSYRGVFVNWLLPNSAVGCSIIFLITATASWLVDFLTFFAYDIQELAVSPQFG
eukprot:gnl/TRDRNA2_/TRDRNA2_66688_c0_seq1.p1 gnl/TRDRNA2_/TRDRNA2_66688_c0~~gnl/TRDRNA2_/TRDRNA2_66688_c0_seq1.p1  ORF type:complete len:163 (-),score=7.31 gnl/TRDRNA2_/TRDRNA2_66688_c0_seq1:77-565(-)